jgi:hypothetical protein
VGGLYYTYALKGDGQVITELIPAEKQSMALDAILRTLSPDFLRIPENILRLIPPKALNYYDNRESFRRKTGLTFDALTVAESTADRTLTLLLHPERAARLVEHHARHPDQPSLSGLIGKLMEITWFQHYPSPYDAEINRMVSKLVLKHLIDLSAHNESTGQVKAIALAGILELDEWLRRQLNIKNSDERAHFLFAIEIIKRYRDQPDLFKVPSIEELPMGPPIGMDPVICDF